MRGSLILLLHSVGSHCSSVSSLGDYKRSVTCLQKLLNLFDCFPLSFTPKHQDAVDISLRPNTHKHLVCLFGSVHQFSCCARKSDAEKTTQQWMISFEPYDGAKGKKSEDHQSRQDSSSKEHECLSKTLVVKISVACFLSWYVWRKNFNAGFFFFYRSLCLWLV